MHFTLATSIVALALLAAAAPPAGKRTGTVIPITKRSSLTNPDKSVNFDVLNSHVASVKAKILRGFENYEKNTGTTHPSAVKGVGKRGAGDALTDDKSVLWYGTISVGTPPKPFTVDFDTGSSDLFLPSTSCGSSCSGHTLWDPTSSSTSIDLGKTFLLAYGDGSTVSGEQYTDTVLVAGFSATTQTLGAAATYSSGFQSSQFPPDGVLGMGFQPISVYRASPVFQTLTTDGQVTPSSFSFKLSSSGAELYIGGDDSSQYIGGFAYAPVTQKGYWQVVMDNIQANGQNINILENLDVIIDTGTTVIIGDPSQVSKLYSAIGGTPLPLFGPGYYTFPCDSFPTIDFGFGGATLPIPPSILNLGPVSSGSSDCVSGILGMDTGASFWIVGDVFLRSVYTTFDYGSERVGFATLA